MDQIVKGLDVKPDPRLIVGFDTSDDAGVILVSEDMALVQTLDFLTPLVDDPYAFGQIAAANSLSDVYAMGGKPLTAMNIVCFPVSLFPVEVLRETLAGGISKIEESGAVLAGGHSIEDDEFKYGLSVTGTVHPSKILRNSGAREGDLLILTKPIGIGVLSTAVKGGVASKEDVQNLIKTASELNAKASQIMLGFDVGACTDVTGFGLAGHTREIALASGFGVIISSSSVPFLPGVFEYVRMGLLPGGCHRTRGHFSSSVKVSNGISREFMDLMFDPQTSGGLLFSIRENQAHKCLDQMTGEGMAGGIIGQIVGTTVPGSLEIV